jgi:DNA-binding CsgD family transcriptional regulator
MSSQVARIVCVSNQSNSDKKDSNLLQSIVESLVDGVLVVTAQGGWVYGNSKAHQLCQTMNLGKPVPNSVPDSIWQICQLLLTQSDGLEPPAVIEGEVGLEGMIQYRVRVRWLQLEEMHHPYLLVTLEDCSEAARNRAIAEAYQYGLTPRQTEVWLLHRLGLTYRNMAAQLYVTPNTIKRHMKDIYVKQKCCEQVYTNGNQDLAFSY